MARPLLKFALTSARPSTALPDLAAPDPAAASCAPGPRADPAALEVLQKDFVLLSLEGAAASQIIAAAAGSAGLFAVIRREDDEEEAAGSRWWAVLDASAAEAVAEDVEARPVVALRVVRRSGQRQPPEALAALSRLLSDASLEPWPLAAGDEELLFLDRDQLIEAAVVLVNCGHAVGPPLRLSPPPTTAELRPLDVERFCGVWRLTSRERPPGTVVDRYSRSDGPMRIQAPNGVYAEMAVQTPGEVSGQGSSCGVLSVSDEAGRMVMARHTQLSFAPPLVGPRRCRVELDAGGGDEGEDVAIETLLNGEGSALEVERWERIGNSEVTVLELKGIDPRPRGSHGHAGFWMLSGRHWVRVTGLPCGEGILPSACCQSLELAEELYGEESVSTELQANFDACCGVMERPGFLSVLRKAWSSAGDPVFYDANKSREEVRKEGDVIIHSPRDGPTTMWEVRSFATDPFTPVPKRLVKPSAPEGLRRRGHSSSSKASSSSGKSSRVQAKAKKKKTRDSSSDSSRPAKKKDSKKSRRSRSKCSSSSPSVQKRREKEKDKSSSRDRGKRARSRSRKRDRKAKSTDSSRSEKDRSRDRGRGKTHKDRDRSRGKSRDRAKKDKARDRSRKSGSDSDSSREHVRDKGKRAKDRDRSRDKERSRSRDKRKDRSRSREKDRDAGRRRGRSSSSDSEGKGKKRDRSQRQDSSAEREKKTEEGRRGREKSQKRAKESKKGKTSRRDKSSSSSSSSDSSDTKRKAKRKAKKAASSRSSSASSKAAPKDGDRKGDADKKGKANAGSSDGESKAAKSGGDASSSDEGAASN